jgi:hypothetical protein
MWGSTTFYPSWSIPWGNTEIWKSFCNLTTPHASHDNNLRQILRSPFTWLFLRHFRLALRLLNSYVFDMSDVECPLCIRLFYEPIPKLALDSMIALPIKRLILVCTICHARSRAMLLCIEEHLSFQKWVSHPGACSMPCGDSETAQQITWSMQP